MRPETFSCDQEAQAWADGKFQACKNPLHPDRLHDTNWKLDERWFCHVKGLDKSNTTTVTDDLSRVSSDINATMGVLSLTEPARPKRSASDLHKSSLLKVRQMSSRLQKSLASCEGMLPKLKRKVPPTSYNLLKEGMATCRCARDGVLDELEDVAELPPQEEEQEEAIVKLTKLAKTLAEHNDALLEAFGKHKVKDDAGKSVVKKDKEAEAMEEEAPEDGMKAPGGLHLTCCTTKKEENTHTETIVFFLGVLGWWALLWEERA